MEEYPLFVPPGELAQKDIQDWSKTEALGYKKWLENVYVSRTDTLMKLLAEYPKNGPEAHLRAIGGKAKILFLENPIFTRVVSDGKELTNCGYALAADLGLLVARYLLNVEAIEWAIDTRSRKYAFYNKPILQCGPGQLGHLDPIGGSIAEAYGVITHIRNSDIWMKCYLT